MPGHDWTKRPPIWVELESPQVVFGEGVLAWSFFRFEGESTLSPTAANANRWAVALKRW
jgi:hypothetical protein